jgi:hypothetical protein
MALPAPIHGSGRVALLAQQLSNSTFGPVLCWHFFFVLKVFFGARESVIFWLIRKVLPH